MKTSGYFSLVSALTCLSFLASPAHASEPVLLENAPAAVQTAPNENLPAPAPAPKSEPSWTIGLAPEFPLSPPSKEEKQSPQPSDFQTDSFITLAMREERVLFLFSKKISEVYKKEIQTLVENEKIPAGLLLGASPEKIARYVQSEFRYVKDETQFGVADYWQSPVELLKSKKGDCEDLAVFTQTLLSLNGIKSFILNIYGGGEPHSVVVFEDNKGGYNVIDRDVLRIQAETVEQLLRWLNPYWKESMIVAPGASNRGRILKKYQRKKILPLQTADSFLN